MMMCSNLLDLKTIFRQKFRTGIDIFEENAKHFKRIRLKLVTM